MKYQVSSIKYPQSMFTSPLSSCHRQVGFTLIELLIALSITSVLTGITIAGYSRLSQRQSLFSAGKAVKSAIIDAQSRAYNSELDCSICSCSPSGGASFTGWYVNFSSREIYGQCGTDTFSIKSFDLPSDIIITPHLTPPVSILFKNSPRGNSSLFPSQDSTICVSEENFLDTYYVIRIDKTGIVSTDGTLVSSCTP